MGDVNFLLRNDVVESGGNEVEIGSSADKRSSNSLTCCFEIPLSDFEEDFNDVLLVDDFIR